MTDRASDTWQADVPQPCDTCGGMAVIVAPDGTVGIGEVRPPKQDIDHCGRHATYNDGCFDCYDIKNRVTAVWVCPRCGVGIACSRTVGPNEARVAYERNICAHMAGHEQAAFMAGFEACAAATPDPDGVIRIDTTPDQAWEDWHGKRI